MGIQRKSSLVTSLNQEESLCPLYIMCMQNCTMTWSLTGLSRLFSTLSMRHPQTGIPRDKQHQKLLHMDQNMWHQGLLLTKIVHIRYTLMYLGVPIRSKSFMFGDNKSAITSSTIPNTPLFKRHHISAYHRVREAISSKYLMFIWKDGKLEIRP